MNKAPCCPLGLAVKCQLASWVVDMGGAPEAQGRGPPQPWVVGVRGGSQPRCHRLNLNELVKASVWTRALETTWHWKPKAMCPVGPKPVEVPETRGANQYHSKGKEKGKNQNKQRVR